MSSVCLTILYLFHYSDIIWEPPHLISPAIRLSVHVLQLLHNKGDFNVPYWYRHITFMSCAKVIKSISIAELRAWVKNYIPTVYMDAVIHVLIPKLIEQNSASFVIVTYGKWWQIPFRTHGRLHDTAGTYSDPCFLCSDQMNHRNYLNCLHSSSDLKSDGKGENTSH